MNLLPFLTPDPEKNECISIVKKDNYLSLMQKNISSFVIAPGKNFVLFFLFLSFIFYSCTRKTESPSGTPEFNPLVSAFTSGAISAESPVQIHLALDMEDSYESGSVLQEKIFEFSPVIKGTTYVIDKRTIEFRPEKQLPHGTSFTGRILLSNLFKNRKNVGDFTFSFRTVPLNIDVIFDGVKTYSKTDLTWNEIKGRVISTDRISVEETGTMISANQGNQELSLKWTHQEDGKIHYFTVDSVKRTEKRESVVISWKCADQTSGSKEYEIPGLNEFTLMEQKVVQQPDQHILLIFSDPLKANQDMEGLIYLENFTDLRFSIEDNTVKVYPMIRQTGTLNLKVEPGILNVLGYKFNDRNSCTLSFESLKPSVRLIGNGVIVPRSEGLFFPFEAVNLKAVDVKIIRIYEDNVAQFLQVNRLDGDYELKRAGRLVVKKTVQLTSERPVNYGEWNVFSLDLSSLVEAEPGAVFRVELSFRKKHSLYECPGGDDDEQEEEADFDGITEKDITYYDSNEYYGWDDYDYYYYNWNEREDPCSRAYYMYSNTVARNVLASNLGIIAKHGNDRSLLFAVTDLRNTEPVENVTLDIFNFQQQLLASLVTDKNGLANVILKDQPYLLIAKKDKQRGYLRLDPGSSLSLSQFDIQGSAVNRGIKGYLYGDRGVWRPGDTLFLTFILEDKLQQLPPDYPVSIELFNPNGKKVRKITSISGLNGFYCFQIPTDPEAPTGNWNAQVTAGNLVFNENLRIETVKPNRLKILLDFGTDELQSDVSSVTGRIDSRWLHGAPSSGLKAQVTVNFKNIKTTFQGFTDYIFTDPSRSFFPLEQEVYSGTLNQEGNASFQTSFNVREQSPGKVSAVFTTRVFEKGGDFSIDQFAIPHSPYPFYTGLKTRGGDRYGVLLTDTTQRFEIVTVDEKGSPAGRKNLGVKIYKLDWKWWWHAGEENLASYVGNSYYQPVFDTIIHTVNGRAYFNFRVEYPDWGRFFVRVSDPNSGHSAGKIVYFDWPGWAGRADRKDPDAASMLTFSSDKSTYTVGETAVITFPASESGRAFLTVENGTRVIQHHWIKTTGGETSFSFTVTEEMTPNIYVNISLIQPHKQTINDLPVRMYGIIPLIVENPETHITPVIKMPDVLKPESVADVTVSELSGREMTYTLVMVDEGLLDLTRFKTPDPWNVFYAREALGVKSFDMYDMVLGAYGGRIDGIFSIGGDEEALIVQSGEKANRFPPVVKFLGPFHLSPKKSLTHKIYMPNYVGSVRTMVVAGYNGAYGQAEKTTAVKKPLMILATLPRVLGPSETVSLPVTVFAMEDHIQKVNLEIEFNDIFTSTETRKTVTFQRVGDSTAGFSLTTKETTGKGKVKVTATSGKEKAVYEVEIDIRSPNPEITQFVYGIAEPGQTWEKGFALPGMRGTNTGTLEVSSLPPVDFGRRLKFLLNYPHGCVEQITSAAFPQLYLADVMAVNENMKKRINSNVQAAVKKINAMQLPGGGVGYWPGATEENDWGTSYAGHFMLEAKRKGYTIPENFLKNWIRYQKKTARNWTGTSWQSEWEKYGLELAQAYRLYTLALAGESETGAMNRLRERSGLGNITQWRLAASYALAGQTELARKITSDLTTIVSAVDDPGYTYGSSLRDMAMILEAMVLIGEREKAVPLLQEISDLLCSNTWYSTQSTAYSLIAVSAFAGGNKTTKELNYDYSINDQPVGHAVSNSPFSSIEHDFKGDEKGNVRVTNKGEGLLYMRLALHGTPVAGQEKAFSSNLVLSANYFDMQGNSIDVKKLEQGTDFISVVSVRNPGTLGFYRDMALTQIFPSGWEIQNLRLFETNIGTFSTPEYQDFRDDRVNTYFNIGSSKTEKFAVKLNAAYIGKYYMPGITCEAMYRNDISALKEGQWIEVVEAGIKTE